MKKTFLEWSVADKVTQKKRLIQNMLTIYLEGKNFWVGPRVSPGI